MHMARLEVLPGLGESLHRAGVTLCHEEDDLQQSSVHAGLGLAGKRKSARATPWSAALIVQCAGRSVRWVLRRYGLVLNAVHWFPHRHLLYELPMARKV